MPATGTVTDTTATVPGHTWVLAGSGVPNTPVTLLNATPYVPTVNGQHAEVFPAALVTAALQAAYEAGFTEGSTP